MLGYPAAKTPYTPYVIQWYTYMRGTHVCIIDGWEGICNTVIHVHEGICMYAGKVWPVSPENKA